MRRAAAIALCALVAGCAGLGTPALDPKEHVRGEHHRLVPEPPAQLWPALLGALEAEGLPVRHADARQHMLETRDHYQGQDAVKRLADIADLASARREGGLRGVSEYVVTYHIFLASAGDAVTSVKITSNIQAIDRGEALGIGGILQPLGSRVDVPSRGVVERELMRRLGASLFTAEEMLLLVGEPGID